MSSDLQKFTLQDLDEIDKVEDSIKKKRKLIIKGLIEQGIAKMVYILGSGDFDNIDGFTPEVNLHAILVTSENKEALKNLHYVSYSLDEDPIYHGKDGNEIYHVKFNRYSKCFWSEDVLIEPYKPKKEYPELQDLIDSLYTKNPRYQPEKALNKWILGMIPKDKWPDNWEKEI